MKFLQLPIATFALALTATLCPQPLHAAPEGHVRGAAIRKLKAFREDLAITPDQKEKIHGVIQSYKAPIKAQRTNGRAARETLRKASLDHGPESPEAKTAAAALGNIARDRSLLIAKIASEVRPILTEEQRRKFEKARSEFKSLIETRLDSEP
jgi:Spy/CpxP family protein refolding chaperone